MDDRQVARAAHDAAGPGNPRGARPRTTGMPTLDPARARPARDLPLAPTLRFPLLPQDREWDLHGVVLLLHGGAATSHEPVRPGNLAAWRMTRFVPAFRTRHRGENPQLAVALLRNRMRGWNAQDELPVPDPVADALWALDQIDERLGPVPVVLAGHSLGGRAALRVAGHPSVRGVAALAPWLPPGEPLTQLADRNVLIAHGTSDRVTSLDASLSYAREAAVVARSVQTRRFPGGHAMLRGAGRWHQLVYRFALDSLGG